ncbi:MAG: twin-arginine translocase subunit TatC [Deltaproteobacteria bacterium]|nr:twin-arginine translocase subunit TatC [Deltaproteobacteria bacterium]
MTTQHPISLTEHLAELRRRLIVSLVAVVIGMGITWNFSTDLLKFVEKPLTGKTYLTELKKLVYDEVKTQYPEIYTHYKLEQETAIPVKARMLNYTAPLEPFFVQCKISMLAGFILALPVVFFQIWQFIAPGLTRKEKRMALPFISASFISFCLGAIFFLIIIWPVIINFSLSYEAEGLQSWFNLSLYINFCLRLILIFGLIFELPIIILLLSRLRIVNYRFLAKNRKYALLASSIVAAFHADLITMFVVMIPIYLMYEISVWVVFLFGPKKTAHAV